MNNILRCLIPGVTALVMSALPSMQAYAQQVIKIDIGSQPLADALRKLGTVYNTNIIFEPAMVSGILAPAVKGEVTPKQALERLLAGTQWTFKFVDDNTVSLVPLAQRKTFEAAQLASLRVADNAEEGMAVQEAAPGPGAPEDDRAREDAGAIAEILVQGSRVLNMDIKRSADDPQPYVVFDRRQIERSGVASLEQFLQQRLPMNTSTVNMGQDPASRINLRGLGDAQALILIDGRRAAGPSLSMGTGLGNVGQTDISGIPLSAVDRIEILPTTASGIYGGSATGGVINVIMRRDYAGLETKVVYDNTFDSDAGTRNVELTGGVNFNDGRSSVLFTGSYSDGNRLLVADRDLVQRGREAIRTNNPPFNLFPAAPPLGATPNIVSVDGSPLILKSGIALGASYTSVPAGYAGPGADAGAALAMNAGQYNWDLANNAQASFGGNGSGSQQALYAQPQIKSASLTLRHEFNASLQVFAELAASDTASAFPLFTNFAPSYVINEDAPSNPFDQAVRVTVPLIVSESIRTGDSDHRRAIVGAIYKLPGEWRAAFDYTWDRVNTTLDTGLTASSDLAADIATGVLQVLRDPATHPVDVAPYEMSLAASSPFRGTMQNLSLRIGGPLWQLPAGATTLSSLVERRQQRIPVSFYFVPWSGITLIYPGREQTVDSAYLELRMPLFSQRNARPALQGLELQLAVRRDEYGNQSGQVAYGAGASVPDPLPAFNLSHNTFGSTDPTLALRWQPVEDVALRASYGTGFLPPRLDQLTPQFYATPTSSGTDPRRGNTAAGPFTYSYVGNSNLKPEESESLSAGLILTPRHLPQLRLSVDYTLIRKTNNIASYPGSFQGLITAEDIFPERIVRGANLPGDPVGWAGPITFIDNTPMNLSRAELEAWDMQFELNQDSAFGALDFYFIATWQPRYWTQVLAGQPVNDQVGFGSASPLEFKGNAGVNWSRGAWIAGWGARHFDSYMVSRSVVTQLNQGSGGRVPSQTYHDVFVGYNFSSAQAGGGRWLDHTQLQFGVRNVFKKAPPFDADSLYFFSPFGDPRLASYYLSLKRSF